jgi:hypothetical protein
VCSRMQFRDICSSKLRSDDAFHFVVERCRLSPCLETRQVTAALWDTLKRFFVQVAAGMWARRFKISYRVPCFVGTVLASGDRRRQEVSGDEQGVCSMSIFLISLWVSFPIGGFPILYGAEYGFMQMSSHISSM